MSLSQAAMGTLAAQRRCVDPPIRRKRSAYVAKRPLVAEALTSGIRSVR